MRKKVIVGILLLLFSFNNSNAQFYVGGSEPASTKWSQIETDNYRIVYRQGLDSLARVYASMLENTASVVGNSIGYSPNQSYKRKMPVILRSSTVLPNGLVTWAPRRMELQTIGDAYRPEAFPWEQSLVIHESRHSSQMQFAGAWPFRWGKIVSGELLAGALAAIYPGSTFMEGDAVVAETALSRSGRGRVADFLEYYRSSFAYGQHRDYFQWRYGSQRYYTPDNYRVGYITVAGSRTLFDRVDFSNRFYERIAEKNGIAIGNFRNTVKEVSGKKFSTAFQEICDSLQRSWEENDAQRGPFIKSRQNSGLLPRFAEYSELEKAGDKFYASRKGLTISKELVSIDKDGQINVIAKMSSNASKARYSELSGNLYWSETRVHPRWENVSYSDIHYRNQMGKTIRLTNGQRYFNPAPSPAEELLAVVEYCLDGSNNVAIINSADGECVRKYPSPQGLRPIETVWVGDEVYMSAISDEGFGIWKADGSECLLQPQPVRIQQLWEHEGSILFTCDRTTVNELYRLDMESGDLHQLSSTRLGAKDFQFSGDSLYYTVLLPEGRMIFSSAKEDLIDKSVDFAELPEYPMAKELSSGEKSQIDFSKEVAVSDVRNYSKLAHLFSVHSWLPVYFDYDVINNLSMSELTSALGLGATLFFQNELGDTYGTLGYSATDRLSSWRNSAQLKLTHTSLFPVFELDMSVNKRNAIYYQLKKEENSTDLKLSSGYSNQPLLYAKMSAYVPLNFSSSGLLKGVIPNVSAIFSNDAIFTESSGRYIPKLNMSVRSYIMQNIPSSRIYPRLGIGGEIGFSGRPGNANSFCSNIYGYAYGYLPGFWQTHGIKASLIHERKIGDAPLCEPYANTVPRGFNTAYASILSGLGYKTKLSIDYAMPIAAVDWSFLSPIAYIRNFELTPHFDISFFPIRNINQNIYSVGADFSVRLGNFLVIPYDTRIGVSYNYKGGSFLEEIKTAGNITDSRHSWDMIFTIDF